MSVHATLPVLDACWNRIGVRGDRSCPKLSAAIHCHNCDVFGSAAQALLDRPASEAYLAELTGFVAEPAETRKHNDRSAVLFRLGAEHLAIETGAVVEVGDARPPRRVPHRSNDVFSGLINLHGRLELCVSLRGLLGVPGLAQGAAGLVRVMVTSVNDQRWVFAVDSVVGIHRFHEADLVESPGTSRRRNHAYVRGVLPREGEYYGVLDLPALYLRVQESLR